MPDAPAHVLVAYDSKNGSTVEVAQAIADRLGELGCTVAVRPAREIRGLDGVAAIIVGAPLYSGRWLTGAHRLIKRVEKLAPENRPLVAVFALGPRSDESPEDWVRPQQQFDRALGKHPSITPAATAVFGGADPPKKNPRRDIRNWDVIRSWADKVAEAFGCH